MDPLQFARITNYDAERMFHVPGESVSYEPVRALGRLIFRSELISRIANSCVSPSLTAARQLN